MQSVVLDLEKLLKEEDSSTFDAFDGGTKTQEYYKPDVEDRVRVSLMRHEDKVEDENNFKEFSVKRQGKGNQVIQEMGFHDDYNDVDLPLIQQKCDLGQYVLKRISKLCKNINGIESETTQKMCKFLSSEMKKMQEMADKSESREELQGLNVIHSFMQEYIESRKQFEENFKERVSDPFEEMHHNYKAQNKLKRKQCDRVTKEIDNLERNVERLSLRISVPSKKTALWGKIQDTISMPRETQESRIQILKASLERASIDLNERKTEWNANECPKAIEEGNRMERKRLEETEKLEQCMKNLYLEKGTRIVEITSRWNGSANKNKEIPSTEKTAPHSIENQILSNPENFSGQENKSIKQIMIQQRKTTPMSTVPAVLTKLVQSIQKHKGHLPEGLFRVSASATILQRYKSQLFLPFTSFDITDPIISADLIKYWLRNVSDLFFGDWYEQCLEMGKNNQLTDQEYREFYRNLPLDSNVRSVLDYLMEFVNELTNESIIEQTRMDIHSYASMLSPALLKSNSNSKMDFFTKMSNSPLEIAFLVHLFSSLKSR